MLNREVGENPALSRSCNVERVLWCHWETGKTEHAMIQSQNTCPIVAQ